MPHGFSGTFDGRAAVGMNAAYGGFAGVFLRVCSVIGLVLVRSLWMAANACVGVVCMAQRTVHQCVGA